MTGLGRFWVALGLLLVVGGHAVHADDSFVLVVSGASGDEGYAEQYVEWRQQLVTALRSADGFRDTHLLVLSETPGGGIGLASREGVERAIAELRDRLTDRSVLTIVLLGHGTFDGVDAKFNLVGPDLDAGEWDQLLATLPGELVVVNTTGSSFPFLERLAGDRRIVITATAAAAQRYETVFPQFFVAALGEDADVADTDKDGQVSVWETFVFASAEVRRFFQRQGRLATERASLDDTGDGRGRDADDEDSLDGARSARVFVRAGVPPPVVTDPSLAPLLDRRDRLAVDVAALRSQKGQLAPPEYWQQLEAILVELARVSREIRRRAGVTE